MTELKSFLDDILIIIVLYKQSLADCESFKSLNRAIGMSSRSTLFIYDNSLTACVVSEINSMVVKYYHDSSNPGVSKAYNEGFKMAIKLNKKWLLLADQDTTFPSTIISDYWSFVQDYPQQTVFVPSLHDSTGLLSPFRLTWGRGRRVKPFTEPIQSFNKFKTINSGMLISTAAYERANGYDERFPLDYSDIAFCDRLSANDHEFVLIPTRCNHNFSGTRNSAGDLSTEVDRFQSFCKAARLYKKISSQFVSLSWIILPRALKLSIKKRTFRFFNIGIEHTLWNA